MKDRRWVRLCREIEDVFDKYTVDVCHNKPYPYTMHVAVDQVLALVSQYLREVRP